MVTSCWGQPSGKETSGKKGLFSSSKRSGGVSTKLRFSEREEPIGFASAKVVRQLGGGWSSPGKEIKILSHRRDALSTMARKEVVGEESPASSWQVKEETLLDLVHCLGRSFDFSTEHSWEESHAS